MHKSMLDIFKDELEFLIDLKQSVSILNNRIHDKLALIAIERFRAMHPELEFRYEGAGVGGIDIRGVARDGSLRLVAEVKSTHTSEKVKLRGPQKRYIEADLKRLVAEPGELLRYLVVVSESTKAAIEQQIKAADTYPSVEIINVVGLPAETAAAPDMSDD